MQHCNKGSGETILELSIQDTIIEHRSEICVSLNINRDNTRLMMICNIKVNTSINSIKRLNIEDSKLKTRHILW